MIIGALCVLEIIFAKAFSAPSFGSSYRCLKCGSQIVGDDDVERFWLRASRDSEHSRVCRPCFASIIGTGDWTVVSSKLDTSQNRF